jgi:hypothetical protein
VGDVRSWHDWALSFVLHQAWATLYRVEFAAFPLIPPPPPLFVAEFLPARPGGDFPTKLSAGGGAVEGREGADGPSPPSPQPNEANIAVSTTTRRRDGSRILRGRHFMEQSPFASCVNRSRTLGERSIADPASLDRGGMRYSVTVSRGLGFHWDSPIETERTCLTRVSTSGPMKSTSRQFCAHRQEIRRCRIGASDNRKPTLSVRIRADDFATRSRAQLAVDALARGNCGGVGRGTHADRFFDETNRPVQK